eukprot:5014605-Pyramimonas_sp.AAC.1
MQTIFRAAVSASHLGWAAINGPAGAVVQTLRTTGWTGLHADLAKLGTRTLKALVHRMVQQPRTASRKAPRLDWSSLI